MSVQFAAILFTSTTFFVILFQILLILGAPWGHLSLGGKYTGKIPKKIKPIIAIQIILLIFMCVIVLADANVSFTEYFQHQFWIWNVVGISFISFVLNIITPSFYERLIWTPFTSIMLLTGSIVAFN